MPVTKKKSNRRSSFKKAGTKTVVVTKSVSKKSPAFSKKVKTLNTLLAKAKLLS